MHRDLKPDNILIERDSEGRLKKCKLIDFGFACHINDVEATKNTCGTPNYVAPEVFLGQPCNQTIDNFALGVTLYLMYDQFTAG